MDVQLPIGTGLTANALGVHRCTTKRLLFGRTVASAAATTDCGRCHYRMRTRPWAVPVHRAVHLRNCTHPYGRHSMSSKARRTLRGSSPGLPPGVATYTPLCLQERGGVLPPWYSSIHHNFFKAGHHSC